MKHSMLPFLIKQACKNSPPSIIQLKQLKTLNLNNNKLTSLPSNIAQLQQLKLLFLANNSFSKQQQQIIKEALPTCKVFFLEGNLIISYKK
ncbi:MAG: leucine-rich repeat domain-containing protein [Aureispira sp.]